MFTPSLCSADFYIFIFLILLNNNKKGKRGVIFTKCSFKQNHRQANTLKKSARVGHNIMQRDATELHDRLLIWRRLLHYMLFNYSSRSQTTKPMVSGHPQQGRPKWPLGGRVSDWRVSDLGRRITRTFPERYKQYTIDLTLDVYGS